MDITRANSWGPAVALTAAADWTVALYVRKNVALGLVWIYGTAVVGTGAYGTQIATLPAGYYNATYSTTMNWFDKTNGGVQKVCTAPSSTNNLYVVGTAHNAGATEHVNCIYKV